MLAGRRGFFAAVGLLAALVRGGLLWAALAGAPGLGTLQDDPDSYRRLAESLAATGTYGLTTAGGVDPTAFRPPLYPWVLSWLVATRQGPSGETSLLNLGAVALLHVAMGSMTAILLAGIALSLGGNRRVAAVAALLVTIDPLLATQSTVVMTETLAALIAVIVWALIVAAQRCDRSSVLRQALGATAVSAALACGFLCRPVFVVWWGLLVLAMLGWGIAHFLRRHRSVSAAGKSSAANGKDFDAASQPSDFRWGQAALVLAGLILPVVITISLWTMRNQARLGRPVWATTHGGYTLLLGNNPFFYEFLREHSVADAGGWGRAWDAEPFHREWQSRLSRARSTSPRAGSQIDPELTEDELAGRWAVETIRESPGTFVYACLARVGRLWSPLPRVGGRITAVSWCIGVYYFTIALAACIGAWRWGRGLFQPAWVAAGLLAIALTAVHALYWSNLRMRGPVTPMVLTLAAFSLAAPRRR